MAGQDAEKKPETTPPPVETPIEGQKAPEIAKPQTGAELAKLRDEIETKKRTKKERQDFLKKEASGRRTTETWLSQKAEEGLTAGIARDTINSGVDEKMEKYLPQFQENGIGDATNVGIIKQAAKDLIYEHYCKTGNSKETTTTYVDGVLSEKLLLLFDGLKKINQNKKYGFNKPVDCLAAFSDFAGLGIISGGILKLDPFKNTLKLQKTDYEFFLKTFEENLIIGGELSQLGTESANMEAKGETTIDASKLFAAGTLVLKGKTRITALKTPADTEKMLADAVTKNLPENLDPKVKEAALKWLAAEVQKLNPAEGETVEIGENGTVQKIDVAAEKQAADVAKQQADQEVAAAGGGAPEEGSDNPFKTGIGFIDKILEPLLKVFDNILVGLGPMLAGMGLGEWVEFMGLSESETEKARQFKEACKKIELDLDTLRPLFLNATEMRKILKLQQDKSLSWEDLLTKYLNPTETDELKKKQKLNPDKISEMFLSPVEEQPGVPGTPATAPQTPPAIAQGPAATPQTPPAGPATTAPVAPVASAPPAAPQKPA